MCTELARCLARSGASSSMRPIVRRMRPATALRARSAGSPVRRGRPPRPSAAASSVAMKSRSARAFSARPRSAQLLGVGEVVVELGETAPILGPGAGRRACHPGRRTDPASCRVGLGAVASEVEHMNLVAGHRDELRQILQPLGVFHANGPASIRQRPELPLPSEEISFRRPRRRPRSRVASRRPHRCSSDVASALMSGAPTRSALARARPRWSRASARRPRASASRPNSSSIGPPATAGDPVHGPQTGVGQQQVVQRLRTPPLLRGRWRRGRTRAAS